MKICVFCASSPDIDIPYFEATEMLAKEFVKNDVEVIYGGGTIGLMGKLADTIPDDPGEIMEKI